MKEQISQILKNSKIVEESVIEIRNRIIKQEEEKKQEEKKQEDFKKFMPETILIQNPEHA